MKAALTVALVALLFALAHTRVGVWLVFDIAGDWDDGALNLSAADGPLKISSQLTASGTLLLPTTIEQASGISVESDAIYISTDQAELFALDHNGVIARQVDLVGGLLLLKQGSIEAITSREGDIYAIGETGNLLKLAVGGVNKPTVVPLPGSLANLEYSGLVNYQGRFLAVTGDDFRVFDLTRAETHNISAGDFLKPGRTTSELMFSGITTDGHDLFIVTENHTSLLKVSAQTWTVEAVFDLDNVEASDVDFFGDQFYVTVDHNYFDPRPPLYQYKF